MSNRSFIRALKTSNITDDAALLVFVQKYHPITTRKSGVRALQDYIIYLITEGINDATFIELLKILNVFIPRVAKDSLLQDVYHKIRQAVIVRYGRDSSMHKKSLTIMRFDQTKWKANKAAYTRKVADANRAPTQFEFSNIKDVIMRIYQCERTKKVKRQMVTIPDMIDMIILVLLCSGSRIGEVLYKATYNEVKDRPHFIKQRGILKTKTLEELVKPILFISVDYFLTVFTQLRELLIAHDVHDDRTATSLMPSINRRIKRYFQADISTHDLRKIYADIAFQVFAEKEKDTAYVSHILGHDINSVQVSTSYLTVAVNMSSDDKIFVKGNLHKVKVVPIVVEVPRNVNKKDGRASERLAATIGAMIINKEKITARSLKKYGYGNAVILGYFRSLKVPHADTADDAADDAA